MNKIIKLLLLSDLFVSTGFGLIAPIFAIFIKENIVGGTIFTAGLASTLYLLVKGTLQLPFSRYVDAHDRKVRWLIMGTFLGTAVPILYIFSTSIYHVYLAQALYGVAAALAYPTWLALWSTNLDKKHEGYEWSLYSTFTGLGAAITAAVGGAIAEYVGFSYTFIFVALLVFLGGMVLLHLERDRVKENGISLKEYHRKRKLVE